MVACHYYKSKFAFSTTMNFILFKNKEKIKIRHTYCHDKPPVMPSRNLSRSDRCRLGIEPGGSVGLPLDILNKDNFVGLLLDTVGLPDSCESNEFVDVVLVVPMFINERCFGDKSLDGVAIFSIFFYI